MVELESFIKMYIDLGDVLYFPNKLIVVEFLVLNVIMISFLGFMKATSLMHLKHHQHHGNSAISIYEFSLQ